MAVRKIHAENKSNNEVCPFLFLSSHLLFHRLEHIAVNSELLDVRAICLQWLIQLIFMSRQVSSSSFSAPMYVPPETVCLVEEDYHPRLKECTILWLVV